MKRVRPFVLQDHVLPWTVFLTVAVTTGCTPADTPLQRLGEARQLAADLSIQFTKAVDATNRAVMANTAETSLAFAREAEEATQAVQVKADALRPVLEALNYSTEKSLLDEFDSRFSDIGRWTRRSGVWRSKAPTSKRNGSRSALRRRQRMQSTTHSRPSPRCARSGTSGASRRW
jgi:hypothetical protein